MSVNEKMTAIANETRFLVGSTDLMGLDDIAQNLNDANAEVDAQTYLLQQVMDTVNNLPEAGGGGSSVQLEERTFYENGEYSPSAGYSGFGKVIVAVEGGDKNYPVLSVCNNTSHAICINGFGCYSGETVSIPLGDGGVLACMPELGSNLNILRYSYTEKWEGDDGEWVEESYSGLIYCAESDYSYGIKIGICMEFPWNGETFYIEEVEE